MMGQIGLLTRAFRKLAAIPVALFLSFGIIGLHSATANAESTKTVFSPFTGKLDFITAVNGTNFVSGSGVTVSCTAGVCTFSSAGGSASNLEAFTGAIRSSPTPTISFEPNDFGAVLHGTTFYTFLNPATTDFIHNQTTPQTAEFNATRGTLGGATAVGFDGTLTLNNASGTGSYLLKGNLGNILTGIEMSTNTNRAFTGFNIYNDKDDISFAMRKDRNGAIIATVPITALDALVVPLTLRATNLIASPTNVDVVLQSTGVTISSDTSINGNLNVVGTGDGVGSFTIGNSTYGFIVSTTPIAPNHILVGSSTNYTAIDGGILLATQTVTVTISSGTGFNGLSIPVWRAPTNTAVTIVKIMAESLAAGTTVLYQLDSRAFGSVNSAGTSTFSVAFSTANNTGVTTTSFSNAAISAQNSLVLTTPAAGASAGSPTSMTFTIYYNRNSQ